MELNQALQRYLKNETQRQEDYIQMIASENFTSETIRELSGSVFTNKYAEGYPDQRYYNGCIWCDEVEKLAMIELQRCFNVEFYSNVQPHSGANANLAVMMGVLKPGDTILSMSLDAGGHLSHGHKVNISGKFFNIIQYGVDEEGFLDYNQVERLTEEHKPKMIIAGASAYPRQINFAWFGMLAEKFDAILLCDIAHYSGLIAGGAYESPFPHADIVTSTTHKTLRGPRGGVIMWQDDERFGKKINSALFPGTQGGPLMNQIAAKAQCFYEARQPEFQQYARNVVDNAKIMSKVFKLRKIPLVTHGTDSHILLLDLSSFGISGHDLAEQLEFKHQIVVNKNSVPNDPKPPKYTSGIRIGTAAETTRLRSAQWFADTAGYISDVIDEIKVS